MIKNIGSNLDLIYNNLISRVNLTNLFIGGIYVGKPINVGTNLSLYFGLSNNSPFVSSDREGQNTIMKRATLEFVITTNKKDIANVVIYEALDILVNELVGQGLALSGFTINSIQEGVQSGIILDTNSNPLLIAEFEFIYKSIY